MIVVDASAVVEVLFGGRGAEAILARFGRPGESLHAPHLLDVEVAQVVRRYWRAGELTAQRAEDALEDLGELPVMRYGHEALLGRIWELRQNVTAYDAAYLALGEALDAPVLTRDTRLAAAPGHRAQIELV